MLFEFTPQVELLDTLPTNLEIGTLSMESSVPKTDEKCDRENFRRVEDAAHKK